MAAVDAEWVVQALSENAEFLHERFAAIRSKASLSSAIMTVSTVIISRCVCASSYCAMYTLTDVRPSCWVSAEPNSSGTRLWTANMTKGVDVCAECQPTAMRSTLGGRCQGAGLQNRETQWMAFGVPGCHGAWVMKTRQERCECSGRHHINLILV